VIRKVAILLAVLVMALASPVMAAPGNGQGVGQGKGGGDISHTDPGNHNANGGGLSNNPHNCFSC
jgi:hypothetical protein